MTASSEVGLFVVDAFTSRPLAGNPAAVCVLREERPATWMQGIAREMNLSETAFVRRLGETWSLRWFTPRAEVPLCGHATLAAAKVLWQVGSAPRDEVLRFTTLSGELTARCFGDEIELDFPARRGEPGEPPAELLRDFGVRPIAAFRSGGDGCRLDWVLVLESESEVREVRPDLTRWREPMAPSITVTARSTSEEQDFVSRFFAPGIGVDEDPVTGSIHCLLATFWAEKLERRELRAYQASERGGHLGLRLEGDRVHLSGEAVLVSYGVLVV